MPRAKTTTSKIRFWKKFGTQHHANHSETSEPETLKTPPPSDLEEKLEKLQSVQSQLANHLGDGRTDEGQIIQEQLDKVSSFMDEVRSLLADQVEIVHQAHSACKSLREKIARTEK